MGRHVLTILLLAYWLANVLLAIFFRDKSDKPAPFLELTSAPPCFKAPVLPTYRFDHHAGAL